MVQVWGKSIIVRYLDPQGTVGTTLRTRWFGFRRLGAQIQDAGHMAVLSSPY